MNKVVHDYIVLDPGGDIHHSPEAGFLTAEASLVLLTWITFFVLLAILQRFAWKPILAGLDAREKDIRRSVEEAGRIHKELAQLDAKKTEIIAAADTEARDLIAKARTAAHQAGHVIEAKAREESRILLENARREIRSELDKARAQLKQESADIAVRLAEKILDKNLDTKDNQKLVSSLIEKI